MHRHLSLRPWWRPFSALSLCLALVAGGVTRPAEARSTSTQISTPEAADIVRFLEQATFGPTPDLIRYVQALPGETSTEKLNAFLDQQFAADVEGNNYPFIESQPQNAPAGCQADAQCRRSYSLYAVQQHFFDSALNHDDQQLRQRVAFALSQIFVVSGQDGNLNRSDRMTHFQRMLYADAFGNFRKLLYDVTLSPVMGRYLNLAGSYKANPNENYAREVLQLFSVGLVELEAEPGSGRYGQPKLDGAGNRIPTYDEATVVNFARAFSGWNFAPSSTQGVVNYQDPMRPVNNQHDLGAKTLLNGEKLPAGRSAAPDLNAALDNIYRHPNVAPFVSRQLIQRLVTSNPSAGYLARVAAVFNDNRDSETQLQEVVRAILLDPEARGAVKADPTYGRLREPVLLITNFLRAFQATSYDGRRVSDGVVALQAPVNYPQQMGQDLFRAPSVFNYFSPSYPVRGTSLVGPEFQIESTSTAIARTNFIYQMVFANGIPPGAAGALKEDRPSGTSINWTITWLAALAADPDQLVDALDQLLMHGTMSAGMRQVVLDAVSGVPQSQAMTRAKTAIYLVATSSQYQVGR